MVNQPVSLLCITFSQMKTAGFIWIIFLETLNVMRCAIWYHLHNSKTVKNTHGGVLHLQLTKSNDPPWVFFTIFRYYKWYQFTQSISNVL